MGRDHIRIEIKRKRVQIDRQRKDIQSLAKAGNSTVSAEAMLARKSVKRELEARQLVQRRQATRSLEETARW